MYVPMSILFLNDVVLLLTTSMASSKTLLVHFAFHVDCTTFTNYSLFLLFPI